MVSQQVSCCLGPRFPACNLGLFLETVSSLGALRLLDTRRLWTPRLSWDHFPSFPFPPAGPRSGLGPESLVLSLRACGQCVLLARVSTATSEQRWLPASPLPQDASRPRSCLLACRGVCVCTRLCELCTGRVNSLQGQACPSLLPLVSAPPALILLKLGVSLWGLGRGLWLQARGSCRISGTCGLVGMQPCPRST